MNKGVIFDFDGVIINSHEVQKRSLETAYRKVVGVGEVPYDDFFKLSGDSLENIFQKLGLPHEMVEIYREYSRRHIDLIKFNSEFMEILDYFQQENVRCILCTGKERKRTVQTLRHFGIEHYFCKVICSDDVKKPKPNPESIHLVKKIYGMNSSQLIMVGDGINDIKCAKRAGINVVAVTWGDVSKEELVKEHPDMLVDNVSELFEYLRKWLDINQACYLKGGIG